MVVTAEQAPTVRLHPRIETRLPDSCIWILRFLVSGRRRARRLALRLFLQGSRRNLRTRRPMREDALVAACALAVQVVQTNFSEAIVMGEPAVFTTGALSVEIVAANWLRRRRGRRTKLGPSTLQRSATGRILHFGTLVGKWAARRGSGGWRIFLSVSTLRGSLHGGPFAIKLSWLIDHG